MKYPVIYIEGKRKLAASFAGFTDERMCVVADIIPAMQHLVSLHTKHAFVLYEQGDAETDSRKIRFLHSRFPGAGIILVTRQILSDAERRIYLKAGVHNALPETVSRKDFLHTLQIIADYTFTGASTGQEVQTPIQLFRMPLWKRTFDIAASAAALLLLSPFLLLIAAAVKVDSPGPVIYKSKRVGSNYRIFDFLKFRSMRTDADKALRELGSLNQYAEAADADAEARKIALGEEEIRQLLASQQTGMLFSDDFAISEQDHLQQVGTEQENAFVKIENDPRITRLGRFLRKYSIDELPQLINILRGDMSVVGNRPLPLYEAERLTSDEYIERFMCPSGLTGLWQVEKRGQAGKLSPEQRKQLDIRYAREMSPWLDLRIILRTFTAFIQKENV